MKATLLVVGGNTTKRKVDLKLPCVLGRSRDADVTVVDAQISRRHCELSESDGVLMLRDLASLNGTMIDGRRIVTAPLLPQGEFTIGPLTFQVLYDFDGDLDSIPATQYADEAEDLAGVEFAEAAEAEEAADMAEDVDEQEFEVDAEELPVDTPNLSDSEVVEVPDLVAWADADPEEIEPAILDAEEVEEVDLLAEPEPAESEPSISYEPPEDDSSLQSGGHTRESPWSAEPQPIEKATRPPAKKLAPARKAPPVQPPAGKKPSPAEDDFGDFLDELQ